MRFVAALFVSPLALCLASCGDGPSPATRAPEDTTCVERVERRFDSGAFGAVDRLQVRAINAAGCAPLNAPLGAFNYFSYADRDAYLAYGARVTQILTSRGHRVLFGTSRTETLEAPPGAPAGGGSYEHEVFALPLYSSAGGFMDMIGSPEFQEIVGLQQGGARQSDYVFGFQRCHVGCDDPDALPGGEGPFLVHMFGYEGDDLRAALRTVSQEPTAPPVAYGGELVARFEVIAGGMNVNSQNLPWGEGTVVYEIASREDALRWIESPVFEAFRQRTKEDVLILVVGGT